MTARALITLAFLILVPLVAVVGTRFTGGVSSAKQSTVATNHPESKGSRPDSNAGNLPGNDNSRHPLATQSSAAGSNIVAGPKAGSGVNLAQNSTNPPNLTTTTGPSASQSVVAKPPIPNHGQSDYTRAAGYPPQSMNGETNLPPAPPTATMPSSGDAATTDPFTWMQRRLRELGAIYYRLENGGPKGEIFRFQCQMAIPGSPSGVQPFEAIDSDPLKAMQRVLQQVEAWHAQLAQPKPVR